MVPDHTKDDPMKVALVSLEERAIEWLFAACSMWVGFCLLMPGDMLSLTRFAPLAAYGIPERVLGALLMIVGMARITALYVNGRQASTPYWRVAGAVCGLLTWTPLAAASFEAATAHPNGIFYGISSVGAGGGIYFLMAGFEVFSVYRAMSDSRYQSAAHGRVNPALTIALHSEGEGDT